MTITTTTCDVCGKPTDDGLVRLEVIVGTVKGAPIATATGRGQLDVCGSCVGDVERLIGSKTAQDAPGRIPRAKCGETVARVARLDQVVIGAAREKP
jgi:hypothetical protein